LLNLSSAGFAGNALRLVLGTQPPGAGHVPPLFAANFPAGFLRGAPLCSATMFDTIKSGITTATEKLTHLRRFL
jgi:hypothetical protein